MTKFDRKQLMRIGGGLFTAGLFALVGWLVYRQLEDLDWNEVTDALAGFGPTTLAIAAAAVAIGYAAVTNYDLIGRFYTRHDLPLRRVLTISFIGYTFSLNLGALIGGLGFRYRLYSSAGLPTSTSATVIGMSVMSNWSGYVLLAGLVFSIAPPELPAQWHLSQMLLRSIGILLLLVSVGYLIVCWRFAGARRSLNEYTLVVPSLKLAAVQFGLSLLSWCAIATVIHALLPEQASWVLVLTAVLTSSIAGVLSHIPGGIGVVELVFVSMLGHVVPESAIVAALLVYRCAYYLTPLLIAVGLYGMLEIIHSREDSAAASSA